MRGVIATCARFRLGTRGAGIGNLLLEKGIAIFVGAGTGVVAAILAGIGMLLYSLADALDYTPGS